MIPHHKDMPLNWAFWCGKCHRYFVCTCMPEPQISENLYNAQRWPFQASISVFDFDLDHIDIKHVDPIFSLYLGVLFCTLCFYSVTLKEQNMHWCNKILFILSVVIILLAYDISRTPVPPDSTEPAKIKALLYTFKVFGLKVSTLLTKNVSQLDQTFFWMPSSKRVTLIQHI